MKNILIPICLVVLFGCRSNTNNQPTTPPSLVIEDTSEGGWGADIKLSILKTSIIDTLKLYEIGATYQDKEIGFILSVPEPMKISEQGFGNGMIIEKDSSNSDQFLQVLAALYKEKIDTAASFTKAIKVSYIDLKQFGKSLGGQEPYTATDEYKLFFEGKDDSDYAELYLNINEDEHWIELKEKDEDYRPVIIKFLTLKK